MSTWVYTPARGFDVRQGDGDACEKCGYTHEYEWAEDGGGVWVQRQCEEMDDVEPVWPSARRG